MGTAKTTGDALNIASAIGDCLTDTFTISSPGKLGSPVICGYNTGQHSKIQYFTSGFCFVSPVFFPSVIIDVGEGCQMANFHIGSSTTTTRQWNIYVTQYTCGQEDLAGPPGCLQYHTGTTGLLKNFGYPSSNTASSTDVSTTHLQNQVYQICIRRESSYCYICYSAWHSSPAGSFGLSIGPTAAIAKARVSTACIDDYVVIPGGHTSAIAAIGDPTVASISKFCGRYLATSDTATEISICCKLQKLWTFCIFHCFFALYSS